MKVLWIAGDKWHPAEVTRRGLAGFGELLNGIEIELVEDARDILYPAMLQRYDVVVNGKLNHVSSGNDYLWFEEGTTEVMPSDFERYVRSGKGFLSFHAGNMADDGSGYSQFVGNYFVQHPQRCEVTYTPVGTHAVLEGVGAFTVRDEHFELAGFADDMNVILKSESASQSEQVAGYTREMGKGRLAMLAPGHHGMVWENPEFRKLLVNTLKWCAFEIG